jgi:hypothetical protein
LAARSGDAAAAEKDLQELGQPVDELKNAKDRYWSIEVGVQRLSATTWADYAKDMATGAYADA